MQNNKKTTLLSSIFLGVTFMLAAVAAALLFAFEKIGVVASVLLGIIGLGGAHKTVNSIQKYNVYKDSEQNIDKEDLGETFYSEEVSSEFKQKYDLFKNTVQATIAKRKNFKVNEDNTNKTL